MNVRKSIRIDGVDYTDKLISVSDIDVGVRDLGLGYISGINVELVFEKDLTNSKGKSVTVGILVNGKGYYYTGIVKFVEAKNNKIYLKVENALSVSPFKALSRYYSSKLQELLTVPVLYGNGKIFKAKGISIDGPNTELPPKYIFLVGDKPIATLILPKEAATITDSVYGIKTPRTEDVGVRYITFPDGEMGVEIWNASANSVILNVKKPCYSMYGYKTDEEGNENETYLGDHEVWVYPKDYEKIKFVYISGCIAATTVYQPTYYVTEEISTSYRIEETFNITVYDLDKPADIIEDILIANGFTVSKKDDGIDISLNFQSDKDYKEILTSVAQQGLLYIIPSLDGSFQIISALPKPPKLTLTKEDLIEDSFSFQDYEPEFTKLKVIWDKGAYTSYYGTGDVEKEYRADFIVDQASADLFANNYLLYYQKQKYVSFETPLDVQYLDLNVGDVITISYSMYSINQNFQIIEKSIRKERIRFRCKEV